MTGTITKTKLKSGRISWGYYFLAGKDEAGKRQQITKQGFETKREAEEALRQAINRVNTPETEEAGDPRTFAEFFDYWIAEYAMRRCAPKTVERYRQLGEYAKRHFGGILLGELQPMRIEQAMNSLHDHGGQKSTAHPEGRPLSAKTVRHIGFLVNDVLETALRWGVIDVNPMNRVELPKAEKRDVTVLDEENVSRFFAGARGTRLYPFIVLAAATGARRGEILALQWPDIDFETGIMTVSKSLEETQAGLRVKSTKSGKPRRFAIPDFALAVLAVHKVEQDKDKEMFGSSYQDLKLVFCRPDGSYYRPDKVTARVTELARKLGFPKGVTLHVLRHSHASQLLSKGTPLPVVAKRLGHASPNITLSIYSHALEADEVAAAKIWNDAMADVISDNRKQNLGKSRLKSEKSA